MHVKKIVCLLMRLQGMNWAFDGNFYEIRKIKSEGIRNNRDWLKNSAGKQTRSENLYLI